MAFCPEWIFDAAISQAAFEFLSGDLPLASIALKYANGLSEKYEPIPTDHISVGAEEFIRLLDEIDAGAEAVDLLRGFCFYRVCYESQFSKRRLKPLFGNVENGDSTQKYSHRATMKRFQAYLFSWRSGVAVSAEAGWKLEQVTEVPTLSHLAAKKVNPLDLL